MRLADRTILSWLLLECRLSRNYFIKSLATKSHASCKIYGENSNIYEVILRNIQCSLMKNVHDTQCGYTKKAVFDTLSGLATAIQVNFRNKVPYSEEKSCKRWQKVYAEQN